MVTEKQKSTRGLQLVLAILIGLGTALLPGAVSAQTPMPVNPADGCDQTLSVPGEYVLTGNLPCTGSVSGVRIASSDVTFHLAGHTISNETCDDSQTFAGIFVEGGFSNVEVEGGTVRGFNDGIILSSSNSRLRGMTVQNACTFGIAVQGANNRVLTNVVTGSGSDGIMLSPASGALIAANYCTGNKRAGVALSASADNNLIVKNILNGNGGSGEGYGVAIFNGTRNVIRNNAANYNDVGIRIASAVNPGGSPALRNQVFDNTVSGNSHLGIWVQEEGSPSVIKFNRVLGSGDADMFDDSPGCGANVWRRNTFLTDLMAGLPDGGPGAGCIR